MIVKYVFKIIINFFKGYIFIFIDLDIITAIIFL